ncbi:MAG: MFS transporter [Planctomycetota bacterium]
MPVVVAEPEGSEAPVEPSEPSNGRRFFYGWLMVPIAALLHVGTNVGQTHGIGVFNPFIRDDLKIEETALTTAYLIASLAAAVPLPLVGRLIDRHGLQAVAVCLVTGLAGACAITASATNLIVLTLGFFLLRTLGQGALTLVAANTPAMWFDRRLGLAAGLVGLGQSAGIAVMPALFLFVVDGFGDVEDGDGFAGLGWRTGYVTLGLANAAVLLPILLFVYRNRPADVGQTLDGGAAPTDPSEALPGTASAAISDTPARQSLTAAEAYRTFPFWFVAGTQATAGLIVTAIFFHLLTMLDERGVSGTDAAFCYTVFAGAMASCQFLGGLSADKVPPRFLVSLFGLLQASGCGLLLIVQSAATAWTTMALLGSAQGLLIATINVLWPRFFGVTALGTIRGSVQTIVVAACPVGPVLVALSRDRFGSENPSLLLFAGMLLTIAVVAPFLRPPIRR